MTKWAAQVDPKNPHSEYPRPQLVRKDWLSLNGIWQYQPGAEGATVGVDAATPAGKDLSGEILVPFPVESALSGVMEHHDRIWYRRSFNVPKNWRGQQIRLNFGAVDYQAQVFVNGQSVGTHTGGYQAFSFDITRFLKGDGPQELVVRVFDPTDAGGQPRGKQVVVSRGINYTSTTGIWQTVWLEPVAKTSIQSLKMVPDIDRGVLKFTANVAAPTPATLATVQIRDGGKVVATAKVKPGVEIAIPIVNAKLWSPDSPFLYDVAVSLSDGTRQTDRVSSYFGMRKVSVGKVGGFDRILLNNQPIFALGPLDQGFWPDGLYTAPTDEALKSDLEMIKQLGFNMTRKHIKIEPARWYYHADKLGLMVWQDMPSANSYLGGQTAPPLDKAAYKEQLVGMIDDLGNHPSIVMWIVFNEGQGYHDVRELVPLAKKLDPTRLVNRDSGLGWNKSKDDPTVGDVTDLHHYPYPIYPIPLAGQVGTNGEYGGIGFVIPNHSWKGNGWGYAEVKDARAYQDIYGEYTAMLKDFRDQYGLSGAVYTQLSDVEAENNGILTYDRVLKVDPAQIALANRFRYPVPTYRSIVATSQLANQTYKYSFETPAAGWQNPAFDDASWKTGKGGFGTKVPRRTGRIGTKGDTANIWLRRTFTLPMMDAAAVKQLILTDYHDGDVEIYINGVLAYEAKGFLTNYERVPIREAARQTLVVGGGEKVLAIHCKQLQGDQYIDVGIERAIPFAAG